MQPRRHGARARAARAAAPAPGATARDAPPVRPPGIAQRRRRPADGRMRRARRPRLHRGLPSPSARAAPGARNTDYGLHGLLRAIDPRRRRTPCYATGATPPGCELVGELGALVDTQTEDAALWLTHDGRAYTDARHLPSATPAPADVARWALAPSGMGTRLSHARGRARAVAAPALRAPQGSSPKSATAPSSRPRPRRSSGAAQRTAKAQDSLPLGGDEPGDRRPAAPARVPRPATWATQTSRCWASSARGPR